MEGRAPELRSRQTAPSSRDSPWVPSPGFPRIPSADTRGGLGADVPFLLAFPRVAPVGSGRPPRPPISRKPEFLLEARSRATFGSSPSCAAELEVEPGPRTWPATVEALLARQRRWRCDRVERSVSESSGWRAPVSRRHRLPRAPRTSTWTGSSISSTTVSRPPTRISVTPIETGSETRAIPTATTTDSWEFPTVSRSSATFPPQPTARASTRTSTTTVTARSARRTWACCCCSSAVRPVPASIATTMASRTSWRPSTPIVGAQGVITRSDDGARTIELEDGRPSAGRTTSSSSPFPEVRIRGSRGARWFASPESSSAPRAESPRRALEKQAAFWPVRYV